MRFRPYYTSTTLVYSANPFTYCFSTHAFFTLLQSTKKSSHKLKALILKMSNLHILLYRYVHGRYTTHVTHTHTHTHVRTYAKAHTLSVYLKEGEKIPILGSRARTPWRS